MITFNKKRIIILTFILTFAFIFSACDALRPLNLILDKAYTFNLGISYAGTDTEEQVTGSFARVSPGDWQGVLNSPYPLQGISITCSDGNLTFSEGGLTVLLPNDEYNEKIGINGAELAFSALETAFTGETDSSYAGNTIEVTGFNGNGKFILTLDKETQLPITLMVPEKNFKAEFSDVSSFNFSSSTANWDPFSEFEEVYYMEDEESEFE